MLQKSIVHYLALLLIVGSAALAIISQPVQAGKAADPALLLVTATPQSDGSILHEVQAGESLWGIAMEYGVQIEEINRLNGLVENAVVMPGDRLVVAPSYTPTTPPTETVTPLPPTITARPTNTPRPPTLTPSIAPSETPTPRPLLPEVPALQGDTRRTVGIGLIAICAAGILLVIVHGLRGK